MMTESSKSFLGRCLYRINQVRLAVWPVVDQEQFLQYLEQIPWEWRRYVLRLQESEKAHVVRLCNAVAALVGISEDERAELMRLSLVHDIGKTITRPSLLMRITRVLFPIPNRSHPILGASILKRTGAPGKLLRRVARHHSDPGGDKLLALFQKLDDNC